jgi:hypothetical protein
MNTTTTKPATCPDCGSYAELYTSGPWAGIWECTNEECRASGSCEHLNTRNESAENDMLSADGEHTSYKSTIEICNDCEQQLESLYL